MTAVRSCKPQEGMSNRKATRQGSFSNGLQGTRKTSQTVKGFLPSKRQMPSPNPQRQEQLQNKRYKTREKKNHLKYFANKFKSQSVWEARERKEPCQTIDKESCQFKEVGGRLFA